MRGPSGSCVTSAAPRRAAMAACRGAAVSGTSPAPESRCLSAPRARAPVQRWYAVVPRPHARSGLRSRHEHRHARRDPAPRASRPPVSRSSTRPSGRPGRTTCSGPGSRPTCRSSASATPGSCSASASRSGRPCWSRSSASSCRSRCAASSRSPASAARPRRWSCRRAAFGVTGQKVPGRHLLADLDRLGDLPRDPRRRWRRPRSSTSSAGAAAPRPRSSPASSSRCSSSRRASPATT